MRPADQIGKQVRPRQLPPGQLVDDQRQGIVAAAGAALPHDDPHADAHKHAAQQRRCQRQGVRSGSMGGKLSHKR